MVDLLTVQKALSAFQILLGALKTNGVAEFITLAVVWWLISRMRNDVKNAQATTMTTVVEPKRPPLSAQQDMVINEALTSLVFSFGATRAYVFQPHNGGHNLVTGMSFQKVSMTHERTAPGVSHCSKRWQGIPMGIFAYWHNRLAQCRELFIPDVDLFDDEGAGGCQILRDCRVKSIYIVALFGLGKNTPIAFVCVDYCSDKRMLTEDELSSYRATALKICGCLLMDGKVCDIDDD